jgi:hypothetical protein
VLLTLDVGAEPTLEVRPAVPITDIFSLFWLVT